MDSFFTTLETRIKDINSLLCVGLDPHQTEFEEYSGRSVREYCFRLIELTAHAAAAFKPNAAFFEALGIDGMEVLADVIRQIPDEIPVILDVKRGDISSTARAYAAAAFNVLDADAVTINPYLGNDAIKPFIEEPSKGAFVLCKTSNPGAKELQDLIVSRGFSSQSPERRDRQLFEWVADLVKEWNIHGNLGLVVGATQVESLASIRENDPEIWILAPGVGAQGGNLQAALSAGLREDGLGLLIPVSRSISRAKDPREEAEKIRDQINSEINSLRKRGRVPKTNILSRDQSAIADQLLRVGCIKFGEFTLKSGKISPIYIDLRRIIGYPELTIQIARAYCGLLEPLDFDHLAGLPYAGLPITSGISLLGGWSMVYPRKEVKQYGTKAQVEGIFSEGDTAVVIDDLITTGGSKLEGISKLQEHGLIVRDIAVLIDRSKDAGTFLKDNGYRLHAFLTVSDLLSYYQETDQLGAEIAAEVDRFLESED